MPPAKNKFQMKIIDKEIVLVLNKHWRAVNVVTPMAAFNQLFVGAATPLVINSDYFEAVTMETWLQLPVREDDWYVGTPKGKIRVPVVIILTKYDKVHKKKLRFSKKGIFERDRGICQYTGEYIPLEKGNLDHVTPKSKGGKKEWNNIVWTAREINTKKSNRTPREAGLDLLRQPKAPNREYLPEELITNRYGIAEWDLLLKRKPSG